MLKKECKILNLVYISVSYQATGSVEISLDFSFKYNSSGIFSTIIGSNVLKQMLGELEIYLASFDVKI